jgi:hypothetical protein
VRARLLTNTNIYRKEEERKEKRKKKKKKKTIFSARTRRVRGERERGRSHVAPSPGRLYFAVVRWLVTLSKSCALAKGSGE